MGNPPLEIFGLRLVGTEDHVVQAGLVDNDHALLPGGGAHHTGPLFIILQTCRDIGMFGNSDNFTHIFQYPPEFPVLLHGPQRRSVVVEDLQLVHACALPSAFAAR